MTVDLGNQIRTLRKSRGWSAQRLSDEVGGVVTRNIITDLENGRTKDLSLTRGVAIAKAFGITAEELLDENIGTAIRRADIENRLAELHEAIGHLQDELNLTSIDQES